MAVIEGNKLRIPKEGPLGAWVPNTKDLLGHGFQILRTSGAMCTQHTELLCAKPNLHICVCFFVG